MKLRIAVLFLFFMSAAVYAQQLTHSAYQLKVHVVSSKVSGSCATKRTGFNCAVLNVTIDGKKYRLEGNCGSVNVLRVGDYPARIVKDEAEGPAAYRREYEFLFADGETGRYQVVGESEQSF